MVFFICFINVLITELNNKSPCNTPFDTFIKSLVNASVIIDI